MPSPSIKRSLTLNFVGDWGQANFHRICSWLCQEFCDRAGSKSRVAIWNGGGGMDALSRVNDGDVDLCIATPTMIFRSALRGGAGFFSGRALPHLQALAVLPQNDRMVLAIDAKFGVETYADLRRIKPPLRIATSTDDGESIIGYVARRFMEAHGIDERMLQSWGGGYVTADRPDGCLSLMSGGEVDAVLQEAIMTPWWREVMSRRDAVVLSAEDQALAALERQFGFKRNSLPAGYWPTLSSPIDTLDFSDFVVVVRNDMPLDVAHLLTWCLVETREVIERQFRHIPLEQSPLSYPLTPAAMVMTPLPLHPGARKYYREAGYIRGS